ncbi:hypothetical protein EGR_04803 [Echinococcus granulosus]|uniref:Uncharacterized protein n=1 Tax=Echinococcus granulosus TaxID=6210 RepID=W6UH91_ECHGR|nr:hypothetical protein EGR_04803 [Echinococcus granulosus]EUB60421.1 hypothetical protein EGR_04803 [Echinococcus granulosus]
MAFSVDVLVIGIISPALLPKSELQQLYCSRCFEHRTVLAVVTGEKGPSVSLPPPVLRPLCFFLVSPQVEMAEETGVWAPTESGKRHSCGRISAQKSGRFPLLKWLLQKLAMAQLMNLTVSQRGSLLVGPNCQPSQARLKIPKRPPQFMPPPLSKASTSPIPLLKGAFTQVEVGSPNLPFAR